MRGSLGSSARCSRFGNGESTGHTNGLGDNAPDGAARPEDKAEIKDPGGVERAVGCC